MATVRKARIHLIYLMAFVISGLFSLFGKQAPLWAQDVERERSARIFNQEFFRAPSTQETGTLLAQSASGPTSIERSFTEPVFNDRVFSVRDRAFSNPQDNRFFSNPAQVQTVNQQLTGMLQAIQLKIQNGENLTAGEMALLIQLGGMN